jgi:hypothetical protein
MQLSGIRTNGPAHSSAMGGPHLKIHLRIRILRLPRQVTPRSLNLPTIRIHKRRNDGLAPILPSVLRRAATRRSTVEPTRIIRRHRPSARISSASDTRRVPRAARHYFPDIGNRFLRIVLRT